MKPGLDYPRAYVKPLRDFLCSASQCPDGSCRECAISQHQWPKLSQEEKQEVVRIFLDSPGFLEDKES